MGPVDKLQHRLQVVGTKAQIRQIQHHRAFVEETDRNPLAKRRGNGGDTHIDVFAGNLAADSTVLREPLFSDVQTRHDLDAGDDRVNEVRGRAFCIPQGRCQCDSAPPCPFHAAQSGYRMPWTEPRERSPSSPSE